MLESSLQSALKSLNSEQLSAVKHIDGAMLILAGAGSGKTKTLTTRLAYLIAEVGIPPSNTLTLTFTNKAAQEMRERALSMLHNIDTPPLLCTFHKFGLIFLRFHISALKRNANFVVLDSTDKRAILKNLSKALPPAQFDYYISSAKNSALSPNDMQEFAKDAQTKLLNRIYSEYEAYLHEKNLLDFDDLLYLTYKILAQDPSIATNLSARYKYIMVDEYQDTNELQLKILQSLCATHNNLCVVGDDDQSIYGFRGADINNILSFQKHFKDAKLIKLETNYRSSAQILALANNLIAHNTKRLGKELKSFKGEGSEARVIESDSELDEVAFLAKDIKALLDSGTNASEIAILFRINALSRSIEEGFNRAKIPYKLIGAMRFYERAEIKDLLSYLRLIVNVDDDYSFLRIINKPRRGIGAKTQEALESLSATKGLSCIATLKAYSLECEQTIGAKAYKSIMELVAMLDSMREMQEISDVIEYMQKHIKFVFSKLDEVDREGNIDEFYGAFRDYAIQHPSNTIADFLNDLALSSATDEVVGEAISCMSVHSAKGLEFKHIYIIGFENGFFPLMREDSNELQEERRLGYVAFTRAKDFLNICISKSRFYRGKREFLKPSQFIRESGLQLSAQTSLDSKKSSAKQDGVFTKGMQVRHKLFGIGTIQAVLESQKSLKINFAGMERVILSSFVEKV